MIEQELILLGLLKESPKHGYEIKKKIREIFSLFAGIDYKSIYYPLRILEKRGLVVKRFSRQGRRPQRITYALSDKGAKRFQELLNESLLNFKRPQFSLDLSLYFLHYIKPEFARRRLHARIFILRKLAKEIAQMVESLKKEKPASLAEIMKHNLELLEAEAGFLSRLTKAL